jgi:hypothetical protein
VLIGVNVPHLCMQEKSLARAEGKPEPPAYGSEAIRALTMNDFKSAQGQVREWCVIYISHSNKLTLGINNTFSLIAC